MAKGNMTSIDDVHQITDTSDKNTIEDKQFITVESKNGNVFYTPNWHWASAYPLAAESFTKPIANKG